MGSFINQNSNYLLIFISSSRKLDVLGEQKDAAPHCSRAASCGSVQTGKKLSVLTSTGGFGFFWRTRAVTQAAAFSPITEQEAEVGLISHQNQKGGPIGL